MGDFKDALIYSGISTQQFNDTNMRIPSTINNKGGNATFFSIDSSQRYDGATTRGTAFTNFKSQTGTNTIADLDKLINNTTIKRACCMQSETDNKLGYKINVKLPYVESVVNTMIGVDATTKSNWKKLGFMTKEISVPKTMCANVDGIDYTINPEIPGTYDKCDKFMLSYCENAKHLYNLDLSGQTFVNADFIVTTPECGCHIDRPLNFKGSVQPPCYAGTWCYGNSIAYKDRGTRTDGACKINECTSIMNLGDWNTVMGGAITDNKFQNIQNCFDAERAYNMVKQEGIPVDDALNATKNAQEAVALAAAARAKKAEADKLAADNKLAADKLAADKLAADKLAADKVRADNATADKLAEADTKAADSTDSQLIDGIDNKILYAIIVVIIIIIIGVVAFVVLRNKSDNSVSSPSPIRSGKTTKVKRK